MSNAVTTACASMVGQNLGAKKYDRVPQILAWGFAGTLVLAIICAFIWKYDPELIFSFFTTDAAVLAQASIIILPAILNFIGAASRCLGFGIINGSGNSKLNLAVAIIDGVIGRIGIAYILGWLLAMGPKGFWLGDALAGFMPCVIGMAFYMSGKWKRD